ncbi:glycosyl hydrolase family 18 protein [Cohnella sp. WQ 127256]|uniref:glycosyl hydrolase family 18 protein n=1 Tax=Cohnella sp. WQ 127256 TaxID=2938790 RepID=UPI002117EB64|nr:glycosyl hydrolase family 18 protein [Cohnella sp. WQ 127256]
MYTSHTNYSKMVALIVSFILVFSSILTVTTASKATAAISPVGPTNLRVTQVTDHTVTLEWDPIPDIADYWVWNDKNGYVDWANGSSKVIGSLTPETTYSFFLGQDGVQAAVITPEQKSNLVTFTTLPEDPNAYPVPPLTPPHNLQLTDITDTTVTLSWGSSPDATGYDIYVNGGWKGGTWSNDSTSYVVSLGEASVIGGVYTFSVGAQKSVNGLTEVSANSNQLTMTWGQLAAPQGLKVVTATRTSASLGWAPTSGATSYDIFSNGIWMGSSASNHYVATNLVENTPYQFKVVAKNKLWTSPASSEIPVVPGSNYNIITYYTSWSLSETGRNFKPTDMDVSQVTHINYAFSDLCWKGAGTGGTPCQNADIPLQNRYVYDGEMVVGDPGYDMQNFESFKLIRQQNPHLNMMVSVGGWSWSKNFSKMAATEQTRRAFANSVVKFLRAYSLDGIDIDWEYPVEGGEESNSRGPEDRENFLLLSKTLRETLDAASSEDGRYYLITIAAAQSDAFLNNADLANSSQYLDFINMMDYDYSGSWENFTHHNAPLYYDKNHPKAYALRNNVNGAINSFLNGGVPSYKLVMGVPFYGNGWLGCPPGGEYQICEGGVAIAGQFGTWESQKFDFSAIEDDYMKREGYVRYWNEASKVPYLYNSVNKDFISYDDEQTMMYKASLIKSLNLAGVMSWEISGDRNRTLSTQLVNDLPIRGIANPAALAAPANLTLKGAGPNAVNIKWDAAPNATGYEVFVDQAFVAYTTDTSYLISSLSPNTSYKVNVIAITKSNTKITGVSVSTPVINVTTSSPVSIGGGGGGGGPIPSVTSVVGNPKATQLKPTSTRDGDTAIVTLQPTAAIQAIESSTSTNVQIAMVTEFKKVETTIPKEVIQAMAKKGKDATLSIVVNGVETLIPLSALKSGVEITDIKITIQSPVPDVTSKFKSKAKSSNAKVLVEPVQVHINAMLLSSGASHVSKVFILKKADIHVERATGVIYNPETNEYRHVPTIMTTNADGTVSVELKTNEHGIFSIIESDIAFQDLTADWYKRDIEMATNMLIASGVSQSEFGVNHKITRAEFVSIIVKALGVAPVTGKSTFNDVDDQTKFATEIATAVQIGLIKGKSADSFDPLGAITRQELAAILENAMNYSGLIHQTDLSTLNSFNDQSLISSYAKASLALMVQQKIMIGVSPTQLDPLSNVTKAQAIVTVMRMLRILSLSH